MERLLRIQLPGGKFSNVSPERSRIMGRIRSKGNRSTEWDFRLVLVRAGLRGWLLHPNQVFGTPDFYFPSKRVAVFIDGCFWHGCPKCYRLPGDNRPYWKRKMLSNRLRDRTRTRELRPRNWHVLRIWEHSLESKAGRM